MVRAVKGLPEAMRVRTVPEEVLLGQALRGKEKLARQMAGYSSPSMPSRRGVKAGRVMPGQPGAALT